MAAVRTNQTNDHMARNIELKAQLRDPVSAVALVAEVADRGPELLIQCDTYFGCARGRLKLREHEGGRAELIWYERKDATDAKSSQYQIFEVDNPRHLKRLFAAVWGVEAVVRKRRTLWWLDNIRIHLDEVESLGRFLELEAVLDDTHADVEEATRNVDDLAQRLGTSADDRVAGSYRELVLEAGMPGFSP